MDYPEKLNKTPKPIPVPKLAWSVYLIMVAVTWWSICASSFAFGFYCAYIISIASIIMAPMWLFVFLCIQVFCNPTAAVIIGSTLLFVLIASVFVFKEKSAHSLGLVFEKLLRITFAWWLVVRFLVWHPLMANPKLNVTSAYGWAFLNAITIVGAIPIPAFIYYKKYVAHATPQISGCTAHLNVEERESLEKLGQPKPEDLPRGWLGS